MYWLKNNWFIIIAVFLIIMFFFFDDNETKTATPSKAEPLTTNETTPISPSTVQGETTDSILVDIKGEIAKPGIYEMDNSSRVNELIEKAGGLTKKADTVQINLAQKLVDEMVIIVPALGDSDISSDGTTSTSPGSGVVRVNINTASLEELMTLNGIGTSKAEAIITYREENGPYSVPEDLLNVTGIGEKTLENMRENIQAP